MDLLNLSARVIYMMRICNWNWTANGDPRWHFWSLGFIFGFVLEIKDKMKTSSKNELRDKTTIASLSYVNPHGYGKSVSLGGFRGR